jgi:hypothetical protein
MKIEKTRAIVKLTGLRLSKKKKKKINQIFKLAEDLKAKGLF